MPWHSSQTFVYKCMQHRKQTRRIRYPYTAVEYDIIGIIEVWWDTLHDWCAAMDRHRLFQKAGWGGKQEPTVKDAVLPLLNTRETWLVM